MKIMINENRLKDIISESVKMALNESTDVIGKVQGLIDAANNAYRGAVEYTQDNLALMDKDGDIYGLKGMIMLKRGHVIIHYDDVYGKYTDVDIKVLVKKGGKVVLFNGDWYDEGWKDAKRILNQIIKDAERGRQHMSGYDPRWEESDSPEEFKANKANMRGFNKSIGLNGDTGIENIRKNY